MASRRRGLEGGWIIAVAAAGLALVSGYAATAVADAGWLWLTRATARVSLALFVMTFAASSLQTIWRGAFGKWLRRNRRQLGLSFALSHAVHAVAFMGYAAAEGKAISELVQGTTLIGGSVGYVFLVALALTSTDGIQRRLGRRWWQLLHRTGMYVLFGIFAFSYLGPALSGRPLGLSAMAGLLGALALRAAARVRGRSRRRT